MLLFDNNKALLQLSKGVSNISKIKDINISFNHIIDKVKNRLIRLFWIPSKEILSDSFIKLLSWPAFENKQVYIKVVDIEKLWTLECGT